MLAADDVAAGGRRVHIGQGLHNIGNEALHACVMHRASQPNPVNLIGAV
ncbi:hypothetical protein ACUN9Y_01720 [Halomonas sp. V046]